MPSRTPPVEIRRALRREVNYGCPICRSPFLTWHHFDPAWDECLQHNQEGMIALCSTCHRQADGDSFTKEQLRQYKTNKISSPPLGALPWKVKSALINFGGNLFIAQVSKLFSIRIADQEVFSLRLDNDDYLKVNACIWDSKNEKVMCIENNDIIGLTDNIGDLECTAQAKLISVISKENDACLSLKFVRSTPNETIPESYKLYPKSLLQNASGITAHIDNDLEKRVVVLIDTDGLIPTIDMQVRIHGPGFCIDTTKKGIVIDMSRLGYDKAVLTGKFIGEYAFKLIVGTDKEIMHIGSE